MIQIGKIRTCLPKRLRFHQRDKKKNDQKRNKKKKLVFVMRVKRENLIRDPTV